MPRLELCAALEGSRSASYLVKELLVPIRRTTFYTDSQVVLGYINNVEKRFAKYVSGRVASILKVSEPDQWKYVSTKGDVADLASRPQNPGVLMSSPWFTGPKFLWTSSGASHDLPNSPVELPEVVRQVQTFKTCLRGQSITEVICEKTNCLMTAVNIMNNVKRLSLAWLTAAGVRDTSKDVTFNALNFMVEQMQRSEHPEVCDMLTKGRDLPDTHELSSLCPFMDGGVIRVGGRLRHSDLPYDGKHPILLPAKCKLTTMIICHHHEKVHHQGRLLTVASVHQAGYHVHRCSGVIRSFLKSCVTCRKLRGAFMRQQMADLPADRLEVAPPFTSTGIDTFGPYEIHDGGATRRSSSSKKIWVLLLTCLSSRAVHLEPLYSMDALSLDLALRRFIAIRGECKRFRSDNGTNFIPVRSRMMKEAPDLTWELTPPGASHQAGVWERKVGCMKNIFSGAMRQLGQRTLSREEFITVIQECASIVNHTPLYEVGSDPNDPQPIYPAMLLNLKCNRNSHAISDFHEPDLLCYGKSRWRRVQYLAQQFWVKWRDTFIHRLTERHKWKKKTPCVAVGDVVLLRERGASRNVWPMARVREVLLGRDSLVRSVVLQVSSAGGNGSVLRRCISDLVLLLPSEDHHC